MGHAHTTDHLGRALPDPSWPPNRRAPTELEPLRRFCNTINRESGADRLATSEDLDRWLEGEGRPQANASEEDFRRALVTRDAFRELAATDADRGQRSEATQHVAELLGHLRFRLTTDDGLRLTVDAGAGIDRYLGDLVAMAIHAEAVSTWPRLKACHNSGCQWLFYDHSNNNSGRWCSMQACGGRHKSAMYRRRQ